MRDEFERWYARKFMPEIDDGDAHVRSMRICDSYMHWHMSRHWSNYKNGIPASKRWRTVQRVVIFLALFAIWCAFELH